jgi:hypothetical protein
MFLLYNQARRADRISSVTVVIAACQVTLLSFVPRVALLCKRCVIRRWSKRLILSGRCHGLLRDSTPRILVHAIKQCNILKERQERSETKAGRKGRGTMEIARKVEMKFSSTGERSRHSRIRPCSSPALNIARLCCSRPPAT